MFLKIFSASNCSFNQFFLFVDVKQIPLTTHSPQSFRTKIMALVSAAVFSVIAIVLVVYIYGKHRARAQKKGKLIG